MSVIQINRVTNANIYINGVNLLGRAEEIKLPDIQVVTQEHKALGMIGKINLPAGFDKMEGSIKWNSFYQEVAQQIANPFMAVSLMVRSSISQWGSGGLVQEVPMVTNLTVTAKKIPLGSFKQNENAEQEWGFDCTYAKQMINGNAVIEVDYMANVFNVNGVSVIAQYLANIGG
jgi:P2 family phage contractile tail tube protein